MRATALHALLQGIDPIMPHGWEFFARVIV
jgi:hypothetical protein